MHRHRAPRRLAHLAEELRADGRVGDLLQGSPALLVGERESCQRLAVEPTAGVEHAVAESADQSSESGLTRLDYEARDCVRVDDDRPSQRQHRCNGRLPGSDASSEADDDHGGQSKERPGEPAPRSRPGSASGAPPRARLVPDLAVALRTAPGSGRTVTEPLVGPGPVRNGLRGSGRRADHAGDEAFGLDRRLVILASGLRWGTVAIGFLLGAIADPTDAAFIAAGLALTAHALLLTIRPAHLQPLDREAKLGVGVELALTITSATATGALDSPFLLTPMVPVVLAGFTWGRRQIVGLTIGGALATAVAVVMQRAHPESQRSAALLGIVLALCGAIGAFARRLVIDVAERHAATLEEMSRLETANNLLVALHAAAQTLPASLDLVEVVDSIRARLRTLLDFRALSLLVRDEDGDHWHAALAEGVRLPESIPTSRLPSPMRQAILQRRPVALGSLLSTNRRGLLPTARSGLYVPLVARGDIAAILAVEHDLPAQYSDADVVLLRDLSGPLGLAVDNARWFSRLRRFGAEAERARIARDLHDRLAQSLAYVTFELERLAARQESAELTDLRDVVRGLVAELRETLYQLRADVTPEHDLAEIAAPYLVRFEERTGIRVTWSCSVEHPIPFRVEQDIWRILQEALANAERHAGAASISVRWHVSRTAASLRVADDGRGFVPDQVPPDRYGLVGMHERADAAGALLTISSRPGHGTEISVEMAVSR